MFTIIKVFAKSVIFNRLSLTNRIKIGRILWIRLRIHRLNRQFQLNK